MGACKAIGSSWFLSENWLSALYLPIVSALKSQLWCQVAVVCIPHNRSPHAKLQLVLLDFRWISPKIKVLIERYALTQDLEKSVKEVSFRKKIFGYKVSQRHGNAIFIAALQRLKTMGSTICPQVFLSGRKDPQPLFVTHKDVWCCSQ